MKTMTTMALAFAIAAGPSLAQTAAPRGQQPQPAPPSKGVTVGDAAHFVNQATMSNMLEIESSRLALEKAKSNDIREFAQMMITDHTKAGQELEAILRDNNMTTPTNKLDTSHHEQIEKLRKASAAQFEREYAALQVKAHEDAIALFKNYAQSGTDAKLKAFAQKTLPDLEKHAAAVKKLSR